MPGRGVTLPSRKRLRGGREAVPTASHPPSKRAGPLVAGHSLLSVPDMQLSLRGCRPHLKEFRILTAFL